MRQQARSPLVRKSFLFLRQKLAKDFAEEHVFCSSKAKQKTTA